MLQLLTFFFSHLYAWLHWNPTHHKKKRLPHAPHNNSVTHLPFMKPTSTLIVLQPSFTYETLPVSLQLCWSVYFIWFRASRIIKHLQHNQRSHVQNGGGELCCEEPLDPDQASMLGICFCYRPHCLLPWQQTEISLHTLHPSAFQHWNHPPLSSLPTPPKLLPASLLPASSGVWGIHFNWSPADERSETDHMTNSDVSEITASFLLSFQAVSIWERAALAVTESHNLQPNELSCYSRTCRSGKVLSGDPAVRPLWAIMHHGLRKLCRETLCLACSGGMTEVEEDTLSHLFGLFHHMSRENTFFWSPNRNRLTSTFPWRQRWWLAARIHLHVVGGPDTEMPDLLSTDAWPDLGLFWTLWPLTSFHSHTLKCQRWMKICQRRYSGWSAALSIWDLTFWQRVALSVFLNPRRFCYRKKKQVESINIHTPWTCGRDGSY